MQSAILSKIHLKDYKQIENNLIIKHLIVYIKYLQHFHKENWYASANNIKKKVLNNVLLLNLPALDMILWNQAIGGSGVAILSFL